MPSNHPEIPGQGTCQRRFHRILLKIPYGVNIIFDVLSMKFLDSVLEIRLGKKKGGAILRFTSLETLSLTG
jgi:hypothetical protein